MYYIWGSSTSKGQEDPHKEEKKKWLDEIQKLKEKYDSIKIDKYDNPLKSMTKEILRDNIKEEWKRMIQGYCNHFNIDINTLVN